MRIFTAIIFLFTFAISQYAKQLGYFECRISNAVSPEDQRCDCEKLLEDASQNTSDNPVNRVHNHIHPDEYLPELPLIRISTAVVITRQISLYRAPGICKGNLSTPYLPPDRGSK